MSGGTDGNLTAEEWSDVLATLPENPETADGWEFSLVRRTIERILAARVDAMAATVVRKAWFEGRSVGLSDDPRIRAEENPYPAALRPDPSEAQR